MTNRKCTQPCLLIKLLNAALTKAHLKGDMFVLNKITFFFFSSKKSLMLTKAEFI